MCRVEQIIATFRSSVPLGISFLFQVEVREMSMSNETSSYNYAGHDIAELLEKIRCLEGKLQQNEIQLERSRYRFTRIFNLISGMYRTPRQILLLGGT